METTVYQSNMNIFHKSMDLLISSILDNSYKAEYQSGLPAGAVHMGSLCFVLYSTLDNCGGGMGGFAAPRR